MAKSTKKGNKGHPHSDIQWCRNNRNSSTSRNSQNNGSSNCSGSGTNSTRKKKTDSDPWFRFAVETSVYHNLEIPKSMRAERFSIKDSENPTLQQWVRPISHKIRLSLNPVVAATIPTPLLAATSTTAARVPSLVGAEKQLPKCCRSLSLLTNSSQSKQFIWCICCFGNRGCICWYVPNTVKMQ